MLELMKMELKKTWRSSSNIALFLILTLIFSAYFFTNYGVYAYTQGDYRSSITSVSNYLHRSVDKLAADKKTAPAKLLIEKQRLQLIQNLILAYSGDKIPQEINEATLAYDTYTLQQAKAGNFDSGYVISYPSIKADQSLLGLKKQALFFKYLTTHEVTEIPANQLQQPALNYIVNDVVYRVTSLVILFMFVIQLAFFFTSEKRTQTIALLNIAPASKFGLLFSKLFSFLIVTIPIFCLSLVLVYLLDGSFYGFGDLGYPFVYTTDGKNAALMGLGTFMLLFLLLLVIDLIFLASLSAFISLFTKSTGIMIAAAALPIIICKTGLLSGVLKNSAAYLPMAYFDIPNFILHTADWNVLPLFSGIGVVLLWSLALYGLSALILKQRQLI